MSLVVPFREIFSRPTGLLSCDSSWERVELRNIVSILNGYAFKSSLFSKSEGFPLIRIRDIAKSKTETFYRGDYPKEYVVRTGDLLIGMDGNFACYEWLGNPALLNQRVCKIIPDEKRLNKKFLLYGINGYLNAIQEATSSVTVGHLSSSDVLKIPFPLPPLNEQRRIVEKLEKILHRIDTSKERLDKIPSILKRFRQAVLAAACSGKLTEDWRGKNPLVENAGEPVERIKAGSASYRKGINTTIPHNLEIPGNWSLVISDELFSFVTSGSRGWAKYYCDKGPKFIRMGNLSHDSIGLDFSTLQHVCPPNGVEGTRTRVQKNDILVSITADVGMIAVVPEDIKKAYINQHVALARAIDGIAVNYIAWFLSSKEGGLKQFMELQRGATKVGLGLDDIRSIWVPLPPLEEQHEIVRRVEALFRKADAIEVHYQKAKHYFDKLTQAVLAKAFRGELVPQDPDDEPASVLLDRIRAETDKKKVVPITKREGKRYGTAEPVDLPMVAEEKATYNK